jgi:hypothetical protein
VQDVGEENKDGRRIEMKKPARPRPCGSGKSILWGLYGECPLNASQRFFRLTRLPDRTWHARTSQMTRVAMRLVISAAS